MATATVSKIQRYQSLIPYLQGKDGEPRLKLDLFPRGAKQNEFSFPFALIDDSHPLSRLLEARFATDCGFTLKKVLLQVQKDCYSLIPGFGSTGNGEIDASWRRAAGEGKEGDGGAAEPLQRDGDGLPVQMAPLFYCREKKRFFPPLCPGCGLPLTLCTDEPLLERFGLAPYRTSLKRYLHCGSCSRHGLPGFYRFETEPDDPVTVKDRWTLMERFRQIDSCMDPDGELPCVGCAERDACFGAEHEARRRMVPFSFYPFHLLITELPTLYGSDFLHLLSGAEPGELAQRLDPQCAPGRVALLKELARSGGVRGTLHPPEDERFFPEVLFLKLSLLSDILRLIEPAASSFGFDRVMVRLPQISGELPAFWNYGIGLWPDVTPASCSGGGLSVPTADLARLALFYIEILCTNSEVGKQVVYAALSRWLKEDSRAEPAQGGVAENLRAVNIFWRPARQAVGEKWLPFWERACAPLYKLLMAARDGAPAPSLNAILEELGELRGELKRALLSAGVSKAETPPQAAVDLKTVRVVLEKLKKQAISELREGPALPPNPAPTAPPPDAASVAPPRPQFDDDETMETVILSPGPSRTRGAPILPPADFRETFIAGQPLPAPPEAPRDGLLETMVAPGSRVQTSPPSPPGEMVGVRVDDDRKSGPYEMTETVFVRPPGGGRPGGRST